MVYMTLCYHLGVLKIGSEKQFDTKSCNRVSICL